MFTLIGMLFSCFSIIDGRALLLASFSSWNVFLAALVVDVALGVAGVIEFVAYVTLVE